MLHTVLVPLYVNIPTETYSTCADSRGHEKAVLAHKFMRFSCPNNYHGYVQDINLERGVINVSCEG